MPNSDSALFHAWLRDMEANRNYDRDWIERNMLKLRKRFESDPAPMPHCPDRPLAIRDRYEEL